MTRFWQNWLILWSLAVCAFGLVLIVGALPLGESIGHALFAILNSTLEPRFTPHLRFGVALMGAVTLGWGLTLFVLFRHAPRLPASIWPGLVTSLVLWFVIDSGLSMATGFGRNAISNTLFLILFLIPVARSKVLLRSGEGASPSLARSAP